MERMFIRYEYIYVSVKRNMISLITDAYESFGWRLERTAEPSAYAPAMGKLELSFKRDRKIRNKAELDRLQHKFDACFETLERLEAKKLLLPSAVAYGIAILGVLCGAYAVFCALSADIAACTLAALPAAAGVILPYPLYTRLLERQRRIIIPRIDEQYNEIYDICERACGLLDKQQNSEGSDQNESGNIRG